MAAKVAVCRRYFFLETKKNEVDNQLVSPHFINLTTPIKILLKLIKSAYVGKSIVAIKHVNVAL